jgi:hypothetical protein
LKPGAPDTPVRVARADEAPTACQGVVGDGRIGDLAAVSVGWFLLLGVRLVVPALFPRIRAEFAFSNTIAGSMYTILLTVAALCCPLMPRVEGG